VQLTIRRYRPADFRILWEIDRSCFPPGISYTQLELKSYIDRSTAFTFVAEANPVTVAQQSDSRRREEGNTQKIMGFLVGERMRSGRGHIITIDIRGEDRRQGVGSILLDSAEKEFRSAKCQAVRLETAVDNTPALFFYKRNGYNVIRTIPRYYSNGLDALLLEKDLHSSP
jgi:[ribosomal protein S18]-alanine N-acetyltransferase